MTDYNKLTKKELLTLINNRVVIPKNATKSVIIEKLIELNKLKFIEVCAGCGGMSSGFIEAGLIPVLLNEINPIFMKTLQENHNENNPIVFSQIDMKKLDLTTYKDKIDILAGGVPCQSFSIAGERKGLEDERGGLILDFNRLILETNPKIFVIENVKGLMNHNNGDTLTQIIQLLNNDNKYIIKYQLLNAMNYEVPQKRERIFIIGIRADLNKEYEFPEPSNNNVLLRDVLVNVPASIGLKYNEEKKKIMDLVPEGGCWINLPEDIKKKYMGKSIESGGGKRGIAKRLAMDDYCLTLTTSPCQKQTERCHPLETRPLNIREYARIQTFPDTYQFSGGITNQYKQIGNAVPVRLAYFIGRSLIDCLTK